MRKYFTEGISSKHLLLNIHEILKLLLIQRRYHCFPEKETIPLETKHACSTT